MSLEAAGTVRFHDPFTIGMTRLELQLLLRMIPMWRSEGAVTLVKK